MSTLLLLTLIMGLVGWFTLESQARSQRLANRAIDLVSSLRAARQDEKNYMISSDPRYIRETMDTIEDIRVNAKSFKEMLSAKKNKNITALLAELDKYQREFKNFVATNSMKEQSLKEMVTQGRSLKDSAGTLVDDQKKELDRLESLAITLSRQRQEKSKKADDANRIIKLMGGARQQEKNYLLRGDYPYTDEALNLVDKLIIQARTTQKRFTDKQNKALAQQIIQAAEQYRLELKKVIQGKEKISNTDDTTENRMATLGRLVEDRASQLLGDQKLELQHLEQLSTRASRQRLDKRIKADGANQIIQVMAEVRQQEKNFLLRKQQTYAQVTRNLAGRVIRQAQLLEERFQDIQNRELADRIIRAAKTYLKKFESVVAAEMEQNQQRKRMVTAARQIEHLAGDIRTATQLQANFIRQTAVVIILITSVLALIFGIGIAVILTKSIAPPIQQLVRVITRLAQEDDVEVPLVANRDEIGQIARAISNFKAIILERKEETEAQLLQAEKLAALGDLVAGVAHEINTPIGIAVTGSTSLQDRIARLEKDFNKGSLKKSDFREFVKNALPTADTILKNLERASDLIKSFKQVAVDQSSQDVRKFRLLNYIDEILISLQPKLKQTSHQVTVSGDRHLSVEAIPGAISQIITNLVINSLTHAYGPESPAGTINIQVNTIADNVIIFFSDDGKGMESDIAKRIYEPFFTTSRGSGGSGLGLSIIFNLVTQTLAGKIQCHSKKGFGTKFEISFPRKTYPEVPQSD